MNPIRLAAFACIVAFLAAETGWSQLREIRFDPPPPIQLPSLPLPQLPDIQPPQLPSIQWPTLSLPPVDLGSFGSLSVDQVRDFVRSAEELGQAFKAVGEFLNDDPASRLNRAHREYNETVARLVKGEMTWRDLEVFRDNSRDASKVLERFGERDSAIKLRGASEAVDLLLKSYPVPEDRKAPVAADLRDKAAVALGQKSSEQLEAEQAAREEEAKRRHEEAQRLERDAKMNAILDRDPPGSRGRD